MNILVVVDMQNDFIDGSLGTEEAQRIVPEVVKKIQTFDGTVFATRDTHEENYLETAEGKKLPVRHCIRGTEGWQILHVSQTTMTFLSLVFLLKKHQTKENMSP